MGMNRAVVGALVAAGVVALVGGTYFAVRPAPKPPSASQAAVDAALQAVTETENSLVPVEQTATSDPAPAAAPLEETSPRVRESRPATPIRPEQQAASPRRTVAAPAARVQTTPPEAPAPQTSDNVVATPAIEPIEAPVVERAPIAPEPPRPLFEELIVPADSVIGLQIETAVSTERAKVEDVVKARVTRDVTVGDRVAIPAGSQAEGSVTLVEKGGRLKDRARLGVRFHSIVLADGSRLAVNTETIYRDGDSPARESATKIGASAVGGAVLGAVLGGRKGAAIGGAVGAAGGGAAVMASEPNPATLAAGSTVTVRVSAPVTVTVEQ
jgi:hypothetical protein